eukprot:3105228-Pyramimonas_sp.AAC.1
MTPSWDNSWRGGAIRQGRCGVGGRHGGGGRARGGGAAPAGSCGGAAAPAGDRGGGAQGQGGCTQPLDFVAFS